MKLAIVLLTYERFEYAERTLIEAMNNIRFTGEIGVHIADDGSGGDHIERLARCAADHRHLRGPVSSSDSMRGGYGKSYNLATQQVHEWADYVLPLEDDWVLERPLNLDPLCSALDTEEVGCIRLGYIGFTQELRGRLANIAGEQYLIFDPDSEERHVFAGHPRLETVKWQRALGPWPEGLNPGETEFTVAGWPAAREGVAWPISLTGSHGPFGHIGAIQARTDQR